MTAGRWSFEIEKGADFHKTLTYLRNGDPVDLTGYTGVMQIKRNPGAETFYTEFNSDGGSDGLITFGGVLGTIELFMDDAITADLEWDDDIWQGRAYHDLLITSPTDDVIRLVEGRVKLSEPVTEP